MKTSTAALAACLLLAGAHAHALTGNQLISLLQSGDSSRVWQAHSYVEAVLDTEATMFTLYKAAGEKNHDKKIATGMFCAPQGTTAAKVVELVVPKLQAEAATLQQNASILIRRSLLGSWPCAENP